MAHNYPKWPKNDARIYVLFPQIFFTEKAVPQTFSLLECMDDDDEGDDDRKPSPICSSVNKNSKFNGSN